MSLQKRSANSFALSLLTISSALTASLVFGATTATVSSSPATSVTATAPTPAASNVFGMLDMRPSLTVTGSNAYMENALEAGYKFSPNVQLTYLAAFDTNLADSTKQGLGLKMWNGFFRMRVRNLLQSDDKSLALSYQGRLYTPTDTDEQAKGYVTSLRTYLSLTKKISNNFSLGLHEIPVLHAYSKSGFNGRANRALFENRLMLDSTIQIIGPVSLYVPIIYSLSTYQNHIAGAVNNNATTSTIFIYPELGVELSANHSVGLSYYSGNLVKGDLSATTISAGLSDGVAQLFWTATL